MGSELLQTKISTTERVLAQGGIGVQWNLSIPLAVRMMDIGCDAQKTPTHIWTRTYICGDIGKSGPCGSTSPVFLQRVVPILCAAATWHPHSSAPPAGTFYGILIALLPLFHHHLNMSINLWGVCGMCKFLQAHACVCVYSGRSEHMWQPAPTERRIATA